MEPTVNVSLSAPVPDISPVVAEELGLPLRGVAAVVKLLDEGATVPFIARYRKEVTGGLDEVQIRDIQDKRAYHRELEERRQAVLKSIEEQGKLTDELRSKILACRTKALLEDLYAPYKKKRRTRATIAREAGLEPLANLILAQALEGDPLVEAAKYVDAEKGVADAEAALAGARDIVAEVVADNADVRTFVREQFEKQGTLVTEVARGKENERSKFEDYYDHREPVATVPSHRFLAIRRGEGEGVLRVRIEVEEEPVLARIGQIAGIQGKSPYAEALRTAIADSFKRLLAPSVETDVRVDLKLRADKEAVEVFAENLEHLLLAAPLGGRSVVGIDPGLRTGCKLAAVDDTGRFLDTTTIYPFKGAGDELRAKAELALFLKKHRPHAIAVGNGTAGRETERFVRQVLKEPGVPEAIVVMVSEAGASVYSASDVAREEFPDLDLTIRGAISIARRLQDPLAELVKVDPKSIGVGQYQHDVHQTLLQRKLGQVVESCVNRVGVDLNTASAALLSYVAGVGDSLAKRIVSHREKNGAFKTRKQILDVTGLGPKAFEQCAGFLRIREAENPLDRSAVHPERYELVARIANDLGVDLAHLVGDKARADKIDVKKYVGEGVGEPTLKDIVAELGRPGRDPRDAFEPPSFRDDVNTLEDLRPGMVLEGVVTNVTAFGAFVDVGVHQDGLVHISQLSDRFIKDPSEAVKVGQKIQVKVLEVDLVRQRISMTARMSEGPKQGASGGAGNRGDAQRPGNGPRGPQGKGGPQGGGQRPGGGRPQGDGFKNNPFANLAGKLNLPNK
ncbi:MAG: Tex family protein [Polyangiales bacterium]